MGGGADGPGAEADPHAPRRRPRPAGGGRDRVSVVIPTRNRRELLAQTLGTVLRQRDVDIEVIVVDDASEDDTAAFLGRHGDPRLRVERASTPRGVARARNRGAELAGATWLAFTDDDDLWAPEKLALQLDALRREPAARWVSAGAVVIDDHLAVIGCQPMEVDGWEDLQDRLLETNVIPGGASGVVVDRLLFEAVGGFDPQLSLLADWDLWVRLALRSPIAVVPHPLHAYRVHAAAMSTRARVRVTEEIDHVQQKYADLRAERGVAFGHDSIAFWMADRSQRAGRRREASAGYLRAASFTGRAKAAVFSAGALAWPGGIRLWDRRRGRALPDGWREGVATWLPAAAGNDGVAAGDGRR